MNDFTKQKTLKNFLILGILVGAFFVAQELREVYPECVKEDEDGYLTVNVSALNVTYVNAIKELH